MGERTGFLVGISIGVALFVLLLSVLCCLMGWRRRDRQIRLSAAAMVTGANAGGAPPPPP
jgi:hypothetical protein